jgi:hypothetical protein
VFLSTSGHVFVLSNGTADGQGFCQ